MMDDRMVLMAESEAGGMASMVKCRKNLHEHQNTLLRDVHGRPWNHVSW
jgi:hypothetical protein